MIHSKTFHTRQMTPEEQRGLVDDLCSTQAPWLYDRHMGFINFTEHQCTMPYYINVFRDPLQRAMSGYYYKDRRHSKTNITFEECVGNKGMENCIATTNLQYFCGHGKMCTEDTEAAFSRAVRNIEKHYTVVGIAEDLDSFFQLIQFHFPTMFEGAHRIYRETLSRNVDPNHTSRQIADTTKEMFKKIRRYEIKLYNLIKQRFHNEKMILDI